MKSKSEERLVTAQQSFRKTQVTSSGQARLCRHQSKDYPVKCTEMGILLVKKISTGRWRVKMYCKSHQSSQVHFRGDKPKHLNITRKDRARGSTLGTQNPLHWQQDVAPEALQSPTGGKNFHRENFWAGLGEVQRQSLN